MSKQQQIDLALLVATPSQKKLQYTWKQQAWAQDILYHLVVGLP